MNQLLKTKTLYRKGIAVELLTTGRRWIVKCYRITTGVTVSRFSSDRKKPAEDFFDAQGE